MLVDGGARRPRDKVFGGEAVEVAATLPEEGRARPQSIPLTVVHEDEHVLVLNKPAGLVVHPGAGNPDSTLQNALLAHDPGLAVLPRAGIVHRLDKDTSGLLIVARTLPAHTALVRMLEEREVHREYEAVCRGVMTGGGTVDAPIDRHPTDRVRFGVREGGREAVSHYRVIRRFRAHTHVRVQLETGRTHQIRVHLAHIGYPLVGDKVYGGRLALPKGCSEELRQALREFPRQALHAARLQLEHPITGKPLEVARPAARGPDATARTTRGRRGDGRRRMSTTLARSTAWLLPEWPDAPVNVRALSTRRDGGVSVGEYASFNLAQHVGDDPAAVAANRAILRRTAALPSEPLWLEQVHGIDVVEHDGRTTAAPPRADAAVAFEPGRVCVVMTADCLPVVFVDRAGTRVGVAHAGWRGLVGGVLEATIGALHCLPSQLVAWLGPAIAQGAFEVGAEVRDAFVAKRPGERGRIRAQRERPLPGRPLRPRAKHARARGRLQRAAAAVIARAPSRSSSFRSGAMVAAPAAWRRWRGSRERSLHALRDKVVTQEFEPDRP